METTIRLNSFSAGDLDYMTIPFVKKPFLPAHLTGLLSSTSITTEIFLAADSEHLLYDAPHFVFVSNVGRGFTGIASLSGTDRYFKLGGGRFMWGEDILLLSGQAEFANLKNISFSVNASYQELEYSVKGILDEKSVNIQGSYGLNVNLSALTGRGYLGFMRADDFPVPFLGRPAMLSFAAQLRYNTRASWSMVLERLEVTDIVSPAGPAQVRVSGMADHNELNIPLLYYTDSLGPLSGKANISWTADYSVINGTAYMGEGDERYTAEGSFIDNHLDIALAVSSMRIDRVSDKVNNALANGDIHLSWDSFDSYRADFNLSSVSGMAFDREFRANVSAILDAGELTVNSLNFDFAGLVGAVSRFKLNGAKGIVETRAGLTGFAGEKWIETALLLTANFDPIKSWFEIYEILTSFTGKVLVEKFNYDGMEQPQVFEIVFSRSDGAFSLSGGPRGMLRFQMDHEDNFYAGLSSAFPVRGTAIGSVRHRTIDARCSDIYIDVAEFYKLLPENGGIVLTGGYVNASVEIKGSITDPEFFGTARATSLRVRIPGYVTHELRPIPFTIAIEGNEMRFGPVSIAAGNGAGNVNGWFQFDRWIPNIFNIDVTIPRETPIPYSFDITGIIAKGDASGKLALSMEDMILDISGDLYVNNTEMGVNIEEMSKPQGENAFSRTRIPFTANMTVNTGPVVESCYPTARFPILRANPSMGTVLRVTADSQTRQYSMTSDIKIRGGEIFYFERSFYIRSGTLTFRENELRFEPRLTVRAEVRDRTEDGPVTVSMIVDNAPLLSFTARFESAPSLSQMEIFALLGQNITGTQVDESGNSIQRAFLNSGTELLTQFIVGRQLEQQIRNFMRLDMFNVRTQVLQNAFYMAFMQSPVDRTGGVGNYFNNTTVFGGKYVGQDMFVQGMVSMRYDANKTSLGGLTFAPDIGVELQSPLFSVPWDVQFSIRWDFIPTHPENWYVNDNSITLTWSKAF
jgi:hypothetical protein